MTEQDIQARDLRIARHLDAPLEIIWRAWSEPDLLAQWWCPKPWRTEVKAFDFRPGGDFHTVMHGPEGEVHPNPGSFLEIIPRQRVVFTTMLTGGWRPAAPPFIATTGIFTMRAEGQGVFYEAMALHADPAAAAHHAELGFEQGWGIVIDQLQALARSL